MNHTLEAYKTHHWVYQAGEKPAFINQTKPLNLNKMTYIIHKGIPISKEAKRISPTLIKSEILIEFEKRFVKRDNIFLDTHPNYLFGWNSQDEEWIRLSEDNTM